MAEDLLPFPRLEYARTFYDDFNDENDVKARLKLQETLAMVAYALERDGGHTSGLIGGSLNYEKLRGEAGKAGIHTFRVTQAIRVSCTVAEGGLTLRRYGGHDYVYKNP